MTENKSKEKFAGPYYNKDPEIKNLPEPTIPAGYVVKRSTPPKKETKKKHSKGHH
ncbi:hypothetical protein NECID01_0245 [Nematocida sp. AWRm77]|nr:hypothetical protein NECID01_0245 [Nematocida sp. AWRm77]